ncbi:hypothetical protein OE470_06930 [Pseudomonas aeruginosa]|nr:hypothetical protein [Pseudomonas aeruginosa]MCU9088418.1 hypothetical protein [Pseudomonas aeruginosa]
MSDKFELVGGLGDDCVLQKYMDLTKFLYLVQNNKLFLSKMSGFDDRLEGGLTAINFLEATPDAAIFDMAMRRLGATGGAVELERRQQECEEARRRIDAAEFSTPFGVYPTRDFQDIHWKCREWIYVSCWHRADYESAAMWPIYGGKNSVCIFTTAGKLSGQVIPPAGMERAILSPVDYLDHDTASFNDKELGPFLSKSLSYSYEREVRAVSWPNDINLRVHCENSGPGQFAEIRNLGDLIDKVVISPSSDTLFRSTVEKLCKREKLTLKIEDSALRRGPPRGFYHALGRLQGLGDELIDADAKP